MTLFGNGHGPRSESRAYVGGEAEAKTWSILRRKAGDGCWLDTLNTSNALSTHPSIPAFLHSSPLLAYIHASE